MRDLVRNCLRMRPERIIVGEVRGPEAFDLLQAMNTGHDGSMGTVHANNPREAISRVENMIAMGGFTLPTKTVREQIAGAVNVIVQAQRLRDGSRKITHVTEIVGMEGEVVTLQDLFVYEITGEDDERQAHRPAQIQRPAAQILRSRTLFRQGARAGRGAGGGGARGMSADRPITVVGGDRCWRCTGALGYVIAQNTGLAGAHQDAPRRDRRRRQAGRGREEGAGRTCARARGRSRPSSTRRPRPASRAAASNCGSCIERAGLDHRRRAHSTSSARSRASSAPALFLLMGFPWYWAPFVLIAMGVGLPRRC